jgi:hypothetical protein
MLIASHALDLISKMGKRLIHLESGRVLSGATPQQSA